MMMTNSIFQAMPDPAPNWMWTLDLINVAGLGYNIENMYVHDVNMPLLGFDPEQRYRAGKYENFPKHSAIGSMMVSFYETFDFQTTCILDTWHRLIRAQGGTSDGNMGLPVNYIGTAILRLYDWIGNEQLLIRADGVWPMRRAGFDLHYQASGNIVVGCEFSVNTVDIEPGADAGSSDYSYGYLPAFGSFGSSLSLNLSPLSLLGSVNNRAIQVGSSLAQSAVYDAGYALNSALQY